MRAGPFLPLVALLGTSFAFAAEPRLEWNFRIEKGEDAREATLVATAAVPEGYIVYASDFDAPIGPRRARLRLDESSAARTEGDLESVASRRRRDETFNTEYSYFAGRAEVRQKLRLTGEGSRISGRVDGQTCHEADGTCTLFRQPFDLPLP